MIPRQAKLGSSFKGCGLYYLHDKAALTSDRVAFTHVENCPTQDPEKALKWMAFTAIHADELKRESGTPATARTCQKPVFTFSLSWHPEQDPDKWEMIGAGRRALMALGLAEHETLMVAHNETEHPHLHLIVNTVHPETGKVNSLSYSRLKLSRWAEEYERENGNIYCQRRVGNNEERDQQNAIRLDHKARIAELYHASDSGKAFREALEEDGYILAQGKRIVVIDQEGTVHSLSRQLDAVKAKDIRARLADVVLPFLDETESDDTDTTRGSVGETETKQQAKTKPTPVEKEPAPEYYDRDQQDRNWQESIITAAIQTSEQNLAEPARTRGGTRKRFDPLEGNAVPPPRLNALLDSQFAEAGSFQDACLRARQMLAERNDKQYGESERELRVQASRLAEIIENSGPLRRWWLELTSQIPRNPDQELANMHASLSNIEWRRQEAEQALEAEITQRRMQIEYRHLREREEFRDRWELHGPSNGEDIIDQAPSDDSGPEFEF